MNKAQIELAQKLVANPNWGWQAGMEARWSRTSDWSQYLERARLSIDLAWPVPEGVEPIPDLDDMATAGVLLGMLHEAAGMCVVRLFDDRSNVEENAAVSHWKGHIYREQETAGSSLGTVCACALLSVWEGRTVSGHSGVTAKPYANP